MSVVIRELGFDEAEVLSRVAADVFDDPIDPVGTAAFLRDPRHHIVVALDGELVVGFVSGVVSVHPDDPKPDLWINEVSVASTHRRQGLAKRMLEGMLDVGRRCGCAEGWVLTGESNDAALSLYKESGGRAESRIVMFTFDLA